MKKDYFRKFKEQDFVRAYEDELKSLGTSAPYVSRDDVILRALHSGKGRYYISFEEAARNVRRIMNRLPLARRNELKVSMYQELAQRVAEYMKEKPLASFKDALFTILAEENASRFFFGCRQLVSFYIVISGEKLYDEVMLYVMYSIFFFFLQINPSVVRSENRIGYGFCFAVYRERLDKRFVFQIRI